MDAGRRMEMIQKMIHPNVTVNSLAMYAGRMGKVSPEALCEFLEVSCGNDIYKTAVVVHRLPGENGCLGRQFVYRILADRCRDSEQFTHLELLAVAVYHDTGLLQEAAPLFTEPILQEALSLTDAATACWLLRMSLVHLPREACALMRSAFCTAVFINNNGLEGQLPELLPLLTEYGAADVLSALIAIAGVEKLETSSGEALSPVAEEMIRADCDSVPLWEAWFDRFFSQPHTPEEVLVDGLWFVQMHAGEEIYNEVCSEFYFRAAVCYGVDHPVFQHIHGFFPPEEHSHRHALRYRDHVDSLWDQPQALSRFLEMTAICNPHAPDRVQSEGYTRFESVHDPVSYRKLTRLFEANTPADAILNIFLHTELKLNLPLEDVFYLAQRYEVLAELLDTLKTVTFQGTVIKRNARALVVTPLSYFTTNLHVVTMPYQDMEKAGEQEEDLKGLEIQYTIFGFGNGFIKTGIHEQTDLPTAQKEAAVNWAEAVEELRQLLRLPELPAARLRQLAITGFQLSAFREENDLELLTQLIRENPGRLPVFLDMFAACKWNQPFIHENWNLNKNIFASFRSQYESAVQLFEVLFASAESMAAVLDLYFSSVYKAVVPLNRLLAMADREALLELLPNYTVYCRLPDLDSSRCRPVNILCGSVCAVDSKEGITSSIEPFAATIADFTVWENHAARITMTLYRPADVSVKERGKMFGYLAKNIAISDRRALLISAFPAAGDCTCREIVFNMSCIETALKLRRSDCGALRLLLQVLGKANPFSFQESSFVDRVYLRSFYADQWRAGQVLDTATTMILNAGDVEAARDLYLHTNIKFYMTLPELAGLVCRRKDLAEGIPTMFDGTVFHAVADGEGMLCMPWVAQNTVPVGRQYAGQFLRCALRLDTDGTVAVTVLEDRDSEEFFEIWSLCRKLGYRKSPGMDACFHISQEPGEQMSFADAVAWLRELLHDPDLNPEVFAGRLGWLVGREDTPVSGEEMGAVVAELVEKWLRTVFHDANLLALLSGIYKSFVKKYGVTGFGDVLCRLCYDYATEKCADDFAKAVSKVDALARAAALREEMAPETQSGEAQAEEAQAEEAQAEEAQAEEAQAEEMPDSFREDLLQIAEQFCSEQIPGHAIAKALGALVKKHYRAVPAGNMQTQIARMTESLMQTRGADPHLKQALVGLCDCFQRRYHSDALGAVICTQARKLLDPNTAAFLEERLLGQENTATVPKAPNPQITREDFGGEYAAVKALIHDPEKTPEEIAKSINKLIRRYDKYVELAQMLPAVAELTDAYIRRFSHTQKFKQAFLGFHECFASRYQTTDLSLLLCLQAYENLDRTTAERLERQVRSTKTFQMYADPELQFDYFMDRERIPLWKELC